MNNIHIDKHKTELCFYVYAVSICFEMMSFVINFD